MKFLPVLAAVAAPLSMLVLPSTALAQWKYAETDHFVYYSEASDQEILTNVKNLEKFDTIVRALTNNTRPASPLKVVIYEVATMDDVNATFPYPSEGVGGYYNSTSHGPFLVTFRNTLKTGRNSARKSATQTFEWGPEVRQHEYLHHYMYQYFNANYPTWYSEGFAEYYGTMAFPDEITVEVGHAPYFRMNAIKSGNWIHMRELLTAKSYADVKNTAALYAQGWLLTHLAAQKPERGKQLQQYLKSVVEGKSYKDAAEGAFGDLDALNKELKAHMGNLSAMKLSLKPMDFSNITVRPLSEAESDLMRYKIRLSSGFAVSAMPLVVKTANEIASREPDSIMAMEIVARLENLAGSHAAARKTAQRLLARDPDNVIGLTEMGKALAGPLTGASSAEEWDEARGWLNRAIAKSAIATDPRVALFQTYEQQGVMPSVEAQNRLVEAFQLMPQNDDIRYLLARDFEQRGLVEDAIQIIEPAAFGSFDGDDSEKRKRKKFMDKAAERFTHISSYESPLDMLKRLQAKLEPAGPAEQAIEGASPEPEAQGG